MKSPWPSAQVSRWTRVAGRHPLAVAFLAALALGVTATLLLPELFVVMAWTLAGLIGLVLAASAVTKRAAPADQPQPVRRMVQRAIRTGTQPVVSLSPTELLDALRQEAVRGENQFLVLLKDGKVTDDVLRDLAGQQAATLPADRRGLLHLASRFTGTPGDTLFSSLAEAERVAADLLRIFTDSLGGTRTASYPIRPGCQAASAYQSWLALNGSAADTALAMAAISASRCATYAALAETLGDRLDERARAYLEFRSTPVPKLEPQALAVAEAFRPTQTIDHVRLLRAYDLMFWNTLATEWS